MPFGKSLQRSKILYEVLKHCFVYGEVCLKIFELACACSRRTVDIHAVNKDAYYKYVYSSLETWAKLFGRTQISFYKNIL